MHGFALRDTLQPHPARCVYTDYSPKGATRIDRKYALQELFARKTNAETLAAAFNDQLAVVLRLSVGILILWRL